MIKCRARRVRYLFLRQSKCQKTLLFAIWAAYSTMLKTPLAMVTAILCTGIAPCLLSVSSAADTAAPAPATEKAPVDAKAEMGDLMEKIKAKLDQGKKTEKDLSDELKQFDKILAEHKGEKTDDVAQVLYMKAELYVEILDDSAKATELFKQLQTDFPDTVPGMRAPRAIAALAAMEPMKKIQRSLVSGAVFPDFDVKDTDGNPQSVAKYKGKVVLVDFWATWCPPCREEIPNVVDTYTKFHDKGLEIVGISRDQDVDQLKAFIKENKMPWPEYFDGGNDDDVSLGKKYGIIGIPFNFLIDKNGKIIDKDLRGEALGKAVEQALAE